MNYFSTFQKLAFAGGFLATLSQAGFAQTVNYNYGGVTGGGVSMGIQVGPNNDSGIVGQLIMNTSTPGFPNPLLTYCTDVGAPIQPSFTYTVTPLSAASGINPPWISGGAQNAATLWLNDQAAATTAVQTAGLQLAIWEMLYNTVKTPGAYGVSTFENSGNGGFYITTTDANSVAAMTAAATDLNGFSSLPPAGNSVLWLAPTEEPSGTIGGGQGLFIMAPPVPETSSTLGLLGAAMLGLFVAQRKFAKA